MLHMNRDPSTSRNVTNVSVLDLLLRGNFSENVRSEPSKRCRFDIVESAVDDAIADSPEFKTSSCASNNETGFSSSGETKTPTSRLDQLPILLARNYFTAPACLLEFINTTSTINPGALSNRDSDGTICDYEDDKFVDCNLDTSDGICVVERLGYIPPTEVLNGTLTRTSLASNGTISESGIESLAYSDTNSICNLQQTNTSQSLDSTDCEPENCGSICRTGPFSNVEIRTKFCVDRGTSPLAAPKSSSVDTQATDSYQSVVYAGKFHEGISSGDDPCISSDPPSNTSDVYRMNPKRRINEEVDAEYSSYASDSNVATQSVETQRELPVYCRSLLYRIRVPLSKRLKNGPEGYMSDLNSHCLSVSRTNLSCDRVFYSSNRSSQKSSESTYSILRLSDLADDTTHSDSSTNCTFFKSNRIFNSGSTDKDRLETPYGGHSHRRNLGLYVEGKYLKPGKLTLLDGEGDVGL